MKKLFEIGFALFMMLSAASCEKEDITPETNGTRTEEVNFNTIPKNTYIMRQSFWIVDIIEVEKDIKWELYYFEGREYLDVDENTIRYDYVFNRFVTNFQPVVEQADFICLIMEGYGFVKENVELWATSKQEHEKIENLRYCTHQPYLHKTNNLYADYKNGTYENMGENLGKWQSVIPAEAGPEWRRR